MIETLQDPHPLDSATTDTPEHDTIEIRRPEDWRIPLVFASPHSGRRYPDTFRRNSRLDPVRLRRSEDAFVDEIFSCVPDLGAPLLLAHFPRAYIDPNREPFELDPEMFDGPLPDYVNTRSARISAGLGTLARVVTSGEEIYAEKQDFEQTKTAIESLYMPYHAALQELLDDGIRRFGSCLLIDCHSMPSIGGPMDRDPGFRRVDFVLGDRHGTSCDGRITDHIEATLKDMDFVVTRNAPYAGGHTTSHYGQPGKAQHALQIEINRALYMDELRIERGDGLAALQDSMRKLIESLSAIDQKWMAPS